MKAWTFPTYALAMRALGLARRMEPHRTWYVTNEGGPWSVVCTHWQP